jgi:nucleotide-binding universal stress UspA family protein
LTAEPEIRQSNDRQAGRPAPQKHILLAYDGSEHAQAAVNLLNDLPLAGNQVNVLAVMPTQQIAAHENLMASLKEIQARLSAAGAQVSTELKAGNPAITINAYAAELGVDLIVMGARGLRATLGILLGGVAQQVVEYSNCPVLVVRAPYKGLQRVLVVTDGSLSSQAALEYLAPLCEAGEDATRRRCFWLPEKSDMRLMHVLPPPIPDDITLRTWAAGPEMLYPIPAAPVDKEAIEAEENEQGERLLEEAKSILQSASIQAVGVLPRGDAATEIIAYTQTNHIDLIVCGSRGLSPVAGWLLGSVSRKLVHYAGCSVLIVKSEEKPASGPR